MVRFVPSLRRADVGQEAMTALPASATRLSRPNEEYLGMVGPCVIGALLATCDSSLAVFGAVFTDPCEITGHKR